MTTKEEILTQAFQEVGKKYGYETVTAVFATFKDFKVQWSRSYGWATFRVSDYLKEADYDVYRSLAETLFARINGESVPYGEEVKEYALDPKFSQTYRSKYIARGRKLTKDGKGSYKDLDESLNRLVEAGLIEGDHNTVAVWDESKNIQAGEQSVLLRTIKINKDLDDEKVPDFVLDYVVYTCYLKIREGSKVFGTEDTIMIRDYQRQFDKYLEAEYHLDQLNLYL